MTLALPQGKCNAPDPSFGEHQGRDGGRRRVFKQFVWLEVGSVKAAWSRPAHQPSSGCYAIPLGKNTLPLAALEDAMQSGIVTPAVGRLKPMGNGNLSYE